MDDFVYKVVGIKSMYDGDSVNVEVIRTHVIPERVVDFGFSDIIVIPGHTITKNIAVSVRMAGFDTPELRDSRPLFKAAAYLAKREARNWMDDMLSANDLEMVTVKDKTGKYGRYLANFRERSDPRYTLKDFLIKHHLAVPYHGQSKSEVEAAHIANLNALQDAGRI